jgi:NAD(P)-dependent dehydrogenase (short-subunit alcohol dehydrogenase family)
VTRLEGKVAFVTGAAGGIGSAICRRFLEEGARVAAVDINGDGARSAVGDSGVAIGCDAGNSDEVRDAIARTVDAFGELNVLCLIAGGSSGVDGPVIEAPEEEFWRVIGLDLFGTFVACKHGLPELIKAGGGSVINFTSMTALMGVPGRDAYTCAKGGVAALTRSLAAEYGRHGIRVNAIAPGMTMTPRASAVIESNPTLEALAARHLLGTAEPLDNAHMAVFLASEESRMVTGQVLAVDSGVTIH